MSNLQTLDPNSRASDPGQLTLSMSKLRLLRPDLFGWRLAVHELMVYLKRVPYSHVRMIREQLAHGDSRAAMVMSRQPLLVAAYTDELDCVAMLRFDDALLDAYELQVGMRLLTVNTYKVDRPRFDRDLTPGPRRYDNYRGFSPMIGDFVSNDLQRLEARKAEIQVDEWERVQELGQAYLRERPGVARDGRPVLAGQPARG